jgi:hypothetical protein
MALGIAGSLRCSVGSAEISRLFRRSPCAYRILESTAGLKFTADARDLEVFAVIWPDRAVCAINRPTRGLYRWDRNAAE